MWLRSVRFGAIRVHARTWRTAEDALDHFRERGNDDDKSQVKEQICIRQS